MKRALIFMNRGEAPILSTAFDTKSTTSSTVVEIRRESDGVLQTFTHAQLLDGTYTTFISGTNGFVKNWYANGLTLSQSTNSRQMKLVYNSGNPYIQATVATLGMEAIHSFDLTTDWIVSFITGVEGNANDQRANLIMRDATICVLGHQENTLSINHQLKRPYLETSTQGKFNVTNIFKLTTYRYVGGALKVYLNNVEKTWLTGDWALASNGSAANSLVLNHRGDYIGKINQYKHLAIIAGGDLSGFNISAYNTEIMTRYGL